MAVLTNKIPWARLISYFDDYGSLCPKDLSGRAIMAVIKFFALGAVIIKIKPPIVVGG